jgi:nitrite reductase/ring-hydroxylating ferredoxin subunit
MNISADKRITLTVVLVALLLVTVMSCSSGNARIRPTWIVTETSGDNVAISNQEVEKAGMAHFRINSGGQEYVYMAYKFGNETVVRSSICPPCRSRSFSIQGDTLICDSCQTTFNARTGDGIAGPCVDYPKAQVAFTRNSDRLVMKASDLLSAYQNTLKPGLP